MEIPRHWRLKDIRYSLKGWIYKDGRLEIQPRPVHKKVETIASSSRLPLYTLDSYMEVPGKELQLQEQ